MADPKDNEKPQTDANAETTNDSGQGLSIKGASVDKVAATPDTIEDAVEAVTDATADDAEPVDHEVAEDTGQDDGNAPTTDPDDVIDIPGTPDVELPEATVAQHPIPAPVTVKRVGFFPLVLGGVVAAGLGAAALYYADQQGWLGQDAGNSEFQTKLDLQAKEIAALQAALKEATEGTAAQFDALSANTVDLAPLETSIAALQSTDTDTTTSVQELATLLQATADRLAQLEVQPIPKAELPTEVVTAYEAQLTETLATIDGRFSEMQTSQGEVLTKLETELRAKLAEIEAAQTSAKQSEADAQKAADLAAGRAAALQIATALERGAGFADQLPAISDTLGLEVPAALSSVAQDGAVSVDALRADFPALARTALADTAGSASGDDSINPLTSIIMTQLGARSLEPREGNSPDAILSRAEAAVGKGDIDTALGELAALPPEGQTAFADWIAQATALRDAKRAAAELTSQLNNQ